MDRIESILVGLRMPSGGVVADTQIIAAAREAADEIERLRAALAGTIDVINERDARDNMQR